MFNPKRIIRFSAIVILLSFAEICWTTRTPVRAQNSPSTETSPTIPQAYWDAVEDARTPAEDEIFDRLTAITSENNTLTWDQNSVLVVTWAHENRYRSDTQISTQGDVWVTVAPDLQNFCKHYAANPATTEPLLRTRINQVLGLPPIALDSSREIAEIWVDSKYLFRPSPDPEVNDSRAEVSFEYENDSRAEVSSEHDTDSDSSASEPLPPNYYQWFFFQYDQRYRHNEFITHHSSAPSGTQHNPWIQLPTPWTQLGYTYDWGNATDWAAIDPNRPDDVGLSEFVIPKGSPISVKATQSAENYCR